MQGKSKYQLPPGSTAILIWNFWIRNFLAVTIRLASRTAMANVFLKAYDSHGLEMRNVDCKTSDKPCFSRLWHTHIKRVFPFRLIAIPQTNSFSLGCDSLAKFLCRESHQSKLWLRYWKKSFQSNALISQFMQLQFLIKPKPSNNVSANWPKVKSIFSVAHITLFDFWDFL